MAGANSLSLGADPQALAALRGQAAANPKQAARAAAQQFEALFMRELVKSMRAATPATGMFDNPGSRLGTDMLDDQFARSASGAPGGLADLIARQLERQMGVIPDRAAKPAAAKDLPLQAGSRDALPHIPEKSAAAFYERYRGSAERAQASSGIPAHFMIAQAAHETGWGRKEILLPDGRSAHNLFGIKAGPGWSGPVAEVTTTEYIGGTPRKLVQKFRAYASADESFADYARLIKDSPRYRSVVAAGADAIGFARGLQAAGYATDPAYADKLTRVIGTTQKLAQAYVARSA